MSRFKDSNGRDIYPNQQGVWSGRPVTVIKTESDRRQCPVMIAYNDGVTCGSGWVPPADLTITHHPDGTPVGDGPHKPETLTEAVRGIAAAQPTPTRRIADTAQAALHAVAGDAVRAYRDLAIVNGRLNEARATIAEIAGLEIPAIHEKIQSGFGVGVLNDLDWTGRGVWHVLHLIEQAIAIIENPTRTAPTGETQQGEE